MLFFAAGWQPAVDWSVLVNIVFVDLPGQYLGMAAGTTIWLDRDAAGYGWFIDTGLADRPALAQQQLDSANVDLLTVLAHELGHLFSLDHELTMPDDIMSPSLKPGQRRWPTPREVDSFFASVELGSK